VATFPLSPAGRWAFRPGNPFAGIPLDISDPSHITLLSTYHMLDIDDQYDWTSGHFTCPPAQESTHLPYFDPRGHGRDRGTRQTSPHAPRDLLNVL
jgi:hypothetical protein